MKKRLAVAGIISVLIVVLFLGVFYNVQNLEFGGGRINQVTYSGIDFTLVTCNTSFIPINIEQIEAELDENSNNIGSLDVTGKPVSSNSQTTLDGLLTFTDFDSMKTFIGQVLDNENPSDFKSTILFKTRVFGIIPYSYQKSYDFPGFVNLIFGNKGLNCKPTQDMADADIIKQQLALAQSRFSATELLYSDKNIFNETNNNQTNLSNAKNASKP